MDLVLYSTPKKINPFVKKIILPLLAICTILLLVFTLSDTSIKAQLIKSNNAQTDIVESPNIQNYEVKKADILGLSDQHYNTVINKDEIFPINQNSKLSLEYQYSDKRVEVLREYYRNMKSPLADTDVPELSIKYADEFGLNKWSLIAAISKIESAGCKYRPGFIKFNCWGYGNGGFAGWDSFDQVLKAMSKKLGKVDSNPTQIVKWYCPPCSNPDHPQRSIANHFWDKIVIEEMQKINIIAKKYGVSEVEIFSKN